MEISKEMLIFAGLVINFIGIIYAVINSKVKLERRLTTLETKMNILMRSTDLPHRRSGDDSN